MAEPIEVHLPTTETLTYDRLERLAEAAQVPDYDPSLPDDDEVDGIVFVVLDQKAADFWIARAAIWGRRNYPHLEESHE